MKKQIVTIGKRKFRYDREHSIVECITKATPDMLEDNRNWRAKFGKDLWQIDADGYMVVASAGLMAENWDNREARAEYLEEWAFELDEEDAYLVEEAAREFCC